MEQDALSTPYAQNSKLAAYQGVSAYGATAADPHGLVLMLMNGAMERMTTARGCLERGELVRKAKLLHSSVLLIGELRGSLNMAEGGGLAQNLNDLYDYMIQRLLLANAENKAPYITEVMSLLGEIRAAWAAIGPQIREGAQRAALPATAA